MRWIFLCLICFNLIYFGWQQYGVRKSVEADFFDGGEVIVPTAPKKIVLLKEVLPGPESVAPPPTINVASRFSVFDESKVVNRVVKIEHNTEAGDYLAQVSENFAEREIKEPVLVGDQGGSSGGKSELPSARKVCAKIGPYDDEVVARKVLGGFEVDGVDIQLQKEVVFVEPDNWVLIPALGNREEALRLLQQLQKDKVDSYLVTEGKNKNAISLGLFKQASSAEAVVAKMSAAGRRVEVRKIERSKQQYWVQIWGEYEGEPIDLMLSQLVEDREKIIFSETFCEMFASAP